MEHHLKVEPLEFADRVDVRLEIEGEEPKLAPGFWFEQLNGSYYQKPRWKMGEGKSRMVGEAKVLFRTQRG